ncbi:M20 family metallopeptidase [Lederbergia sp. NSJ-179]|uniref:M20 family metallopeptidase n=1 Tax=Lederbergia sp. NSJ-179 TaxID=2931402 RepID=UPI001FD26FFA|nr:M20 family metallopeptidase [Lederbergia sp. NSJ-179]MCJ7841609.1 M20 family metallopeptidase [Lederbergia sp. NSJ-179]
MKEEIKNSIITEIDDKKASLIEVSEYIHANPELCYEEFKAVERITGYLESLNIPVERNFCDLETSFKTTHSVGDRDIHFAILAEYDALPKIGHACGHNIIATAAIGAFLGCIKAMQKFDIQGKVSLIGTPAEEGGGGKIKLIERGAFRDIDAATMVHPSSGTTRIAGRCTATHSFEIEYFGKPAHAASQPFKGINALDAANLFFTSVGLLRQQVTSDVRLSGFIVEGGTATNMIPDYTKIKYSVRCLEEAELPDLVQKVKNCIEASAMATGCEVKVVEEKGYAARTYSEVLGNVCREALESLGETVLPDFPDDFGSTDFGNVSQMIPTTNPYFSLSKTRVSLHTPEYEKLAISEISHTAIERAAKAMSMTVIETLLNPEILERAKAEKNAAVDINTRPR